MNLLLISSVFFRFIKNNFDNKMPEPIRDNPFINDDMITSGFIGRAGAFLRALDLTKHDGDDPKSWDDLGEVYASIQTIGIVLAGEMKDGDVEQAHVDELEQLLRKRLRECYEIYYPTKEEINKQK